MKSGSTASPPGLCFAGRLPAGLQIAPFRRDAEVALRYRELRMSGLSGIFLCLACEMQAAVRPVAAMPVDVELVLAVDASRSMDPEESELQRAGYVEALRSPDFLDAVRRGPHGRIAVAYFEWAADIRLESVVPWHVIADEASAAAFAAKLDSAPRDTFRSTSISAALTYAAGLFETSGHDGLRRVIDVSGDGPNNRGGPVTEARDAVLARGIVINGLPILVRPSQGVLELDRYYAECVTGGPGSFVLPIRTREEFAVAIRRKLVMEVSGTVPEPIIVKTQGAPAVDCASSYRDPRFFGDPDFPPGP
jgi:hypothetical protein